MVDIITVTPDNHIATYNCVRGWGGVTISVVLRFSTKELKFAT
jgi:hypothetical protein